MLDPRDGSRIDTANSQPSALHFRFLGPLAWLAEEQRFLLYEAYGYQDFEAHSMLKLEPHSGRASLVAERSSAWPWARWRVTDMVVVPDSPWVVVAQEQEWRGPREVALAALDRRRGRWFPLIRPCDSGNCADARLAVAEKGHIGFGFRDLARRKTVLQTYRFVEGPQAESQKTR